MTDNHKDDPYASLDDLDGDFPVPPVRGQRKPAPAAVDHFPEGDDEAEEVAVPVDEVRRRSPLRNGRPAPVDAAHDDDTFGFEDGESGEAPGAGDAEFGHEDDYGDDEQHGAGRDGAFPGEDGADGEGAESPAKPPIDFKKYGIYGAAVAAVAMVGVAGWGFVAPMFGAGDAHPPAIVSAGGPKLPSDVRVSGGQPGLPPRVAVAAPALPGAAPTLTKLPGPDGQVPPKLPQAPVQVQPAPLAVGPLVTTPVAPQVDKAVLDAVSARLERLESQLSALASRKDVDSRLGGIEERLGSVEARAVAPTTPRVGVTVPDKPKVVTSWELKGVAKGVAWLQGPGGFVEARVGSELDAGGGVVKSISRYADDWVVMTTTGVIMRK